MNSPTLTLKFPAHLGYQRDWIWRGWRIRYTYMRPARSSLMADGQPSVTSKPLLLLHGFGSALGQWRYNLQPLSQDHCVYALDFLGFGGSQKAPANYNVSLWSRIVYDFWREFIGQPAVVIGHSLGAFVALNTVSNHPDMASSLILLTLPDTQSKQPPAFARYVEKIFASPVLLWPLFRVIRRPAVLRKVLKKIYLRPELVDEELVSMFAIPPLDPGALDVFCRLARSRNDPNYSGKSIKQLLQELPIPILVIWGQRDNIVPLRGFRQYLQINPQLQLVEIENAGHCAYDEYPEQVNQHILTWITQCGQ
jgi:pimeloyl-ACP methyl ester carboxylesterase